MNPELSWRIESDCDRQILKLWHARNTNSTCHHWSGLLFQRLWPFVVNQLTQAQRGLLEVCKTPAAGSHRDEQASVICSLNTYQVQCLITQSMIERSRLESALGIRQAIDEWPSENRVLAKDMLFLVRSHACHFSQTEILQKMIDSGEEADIENMLSTLSFLAESQLVQQINCPDGAVFYDRNTEPHAHLYYRRSNRLVDCSIDCREPFRECAELISPLTGSSR